jgi:hypothetical protein
MVFDNKDIEVLRLIALCRYVPVTARTMYEDPFFRKSVIDDLLLKRYIRYTQNEIAYRITRRGRDLLCGAGYSYPDDSRPYHTGQVFERRLLSADMTVLLHRAGIDVFTESAAELKGKAYLSSLMIRTEVSGKALAGARFLGILYNNGEVYVPYRVTGMEPAIHTRSDENTFRAVISNIKEKTSLKVIYAGKTLEELWRNTFDKTAKEKSVKGRSSFGLAFEEFVYGVCLLECSRNGVFQMQLMAAPDYRKKIVSKLCGDEPPPKEFALSDGMYVYGEERAPFILTVDMDIKRTYNAIAQAQALGKIPVVACMDFQKNILMKMADYYRCEQINIMAFSKSDIHSMLGGFDGEKSAVKAYVTKEGGNLSI